MVSIMAERLAAADRVVLLLALVPYLRAHGEVDLADLAAEFGVSMAHMRELVEFLGMAGAPGETETYQDEDLFDIDWTALEEEGVVRLTRTVVVDEAPRFTALERASLLAGLTALMPVLPEEEQAHARKAIEKLKWGDERLETAKDRPSPVVPITAAAESTDSALAKISGAIERDELIGFEYVDLRGQRSSRRVIPIGLVQTPTGWYLRAFCCDRGAERSFALEGMRGAAVSARTADDPAGDIAVTGLREARILTVGPTEAPITASVRVREQSLHRIAPFGPRVGRPSADGWVRAEVKLAFPAAAVRLVQSAPGDIVVETPRSCRDAVLDWADRALAQYDG